ncbi:MAG: dipeptidase [Acidobacteriota bacterium]
MKKQYFLILSILFVLLGFFSSACQTAPEKNLKEEAFLIHQKVLTVDTHCDTPMMMLREDWNIGERHQPGERRSGQIDLPRMKEGGLDASFFAVYVNQGPLTTEGYKQAKEKADRMLAAIEKMFQENSDIVELATSPADAVRLEKEGKVAVFLGMENGYPLGKDLSLVEKYYQRGIRYITLCHSRDNDICDSSTDEENPEDRGLSEFGKQVVSECNRLGIMVDVSHASDKTFYDVLQTSRAPVITSHSSVRAICDHPRNLSDGMIKALADNGGVIQICFVSSFLKKSPPNPEREKALQGLREKYGPRNKIIDEKTREKMWQDYQEIMAKYPLDRATVSDLMDHIDYVVKLVGVDYVGIGTDFDGGGGVEGCNDVTELPQVTIELYRRGYSEEEIAKIWGGNIMRVFRKVIQIAEETV